MANQSNNMVESLASLLKQVRLFGYGNSDPSLEISIKQNPNLSPNLIPNAQPKDTVYQQIPYISSQYSQFSEYSSYSLSSTLPDYDDIPSSPLDVPEYHDSSSLNLPDYNNTPPLTDAFPTYPYEEDQYSEKEDEKTEGQDLDDRRESPRVIEEASPLPSSLPEYSMNEVAQHDMMHDCWMILYDKVYDVTQFLYEHPGGEDLLMEHAGRDGTLAFRGVGHSKAALQSLKEYLIGILPEQERMFSTWLNE